jgi:hypothetical protein
MLRHQNAASTDPAPNAHPKVPSAEAGSSARDSERAGTTIHTSETVVAHSAICLAALTSEVPRTAVGVSGEDGFKSELLSDLGCGFQIVDRE